MLIQSIASILDQEVTITWFHDREGYDLLREVLVYGREVDRGAVAVARLSSDCDRQPTGERLRRAWLPLDHPCSAPSTVILVSSIWPGVPTIAMEDADDFDLRIATTRRAFQRAFALCVAGGNEPYANGWADLAVQLEEEIGA